MKFVIGGKVIELRDIGEPLDTQFISFYSAYFGHSSLDLSIFEKAVIEYFGSHSNYGQHHDNYFNNFTLIWNNYLSSGNFDEAEHIWRMALDPILKWENINPGKRIHKGTPYYFWGMTAILHGDLDKGYVLMHKAVEEDVLSFGRDAAITKPGFAFVSLNYAKADQAFKSWLLEQARFLNSMQNQYSSLYSRSFILEDFRGKFLSSPLNIEAVALFSYTIARLMRLNTLPVQVLRLKFTGQLELNLLFDVVLVIDDAIRAKNPGDKYFIDHAEFLLNKAGTPLSNEDLREINQGFNDDINSTLKTILDGSFVLKKGFMLKGLQTDVAIAYGLRNHGAHNVSSIPTIPERFLEIQQGLMNVLFAAVDYLY